MRNFSRKSTKEFPPRLKGPAGSLILLALVVMLVTLPFVNKAFDWDDREFIEFAEVFAQDPLQFHLEDLSYKGNYFEEFRTTHPPLPSEYLSLFLRMGFSVSEPVLRAAYLLFPLIAAVSMYALARRFTTLPFWATLLMIVTPGFMVISHTLMGDMPGLSMWLASVALFVWGADRGSWKLLIASGAAMAAAVLTAYQAISVIPLLLLYVFISRRFRLRVFLPFLFPAVIFGLYTLFIYQHYGEFPVLAYRVERSIIWENPWQKIRALLVFIGGATVFAPSVIALFFRKKLDVLFAFLLAPPLITWAALYSLGKGQLSLYQAPLIAVLVLAGFATAYKLLASSAGGAAAAIRAKKWGDWADPLFLTAWFAGVFIYSGLFLPFVAVRFLLPLFPPAILLFAREAGKLWPGRPLARNVFLYATVFLTFTLGMIASLSDYRLANAQRNLAEEMGRRYQNYGHKVWVLSEFGFRYYMQQQGFEYLGIRSEANSGDLVISSRISSDQVVAPPPPEFSRVISREVISDGFPVRIMSSQGGAGFYAHRIGPIPFTFSRDNLDEVTIYELKW